MSAGVTTAPVDSEPELPADRRHRVGTREPIAWREPPTDWHGVGTIAAAFLLMTAALVAVGTAIVWWWESSAPGRLDADVNRWLEDQRTDGWTQLANIGSGFSDARTVIVVGVVALPICLLLFRRWHDYVLLAGAVGLESAVFLTSSMMVGRDRPPVERLGGAPTDSFPSGHIAASVALYGGFAAIVFLQTRRAHLRWIAGVFAVGVVSIVVASRLYLGMHYPTDALSGLVLGTAAVAVMVRVTRRPSDRPPSR